MNTTRIFSMGAAAAMLALSACASPFRADVARFQAMPAPQGQTFTIRAADPRNAGGLEFSQYAGLVAQRLEGQGYRAASNPGAANLVVTLDYGVDSGKERIVTRPGIGSGFGGGWGRPYGRWGYRSAFYYGWDDPFWFGGYPDVSSYTYYTSYLDMTINGRGGERVFEGKAKARSTTDSLPALVPNLVEAMFTNFPGRSGEEVRISIPPPKRG